MVTVEIYRRPFAVRQPIVQVKLRVGMPKASPYIAVVPLGFVEARGLVLQRKKAGNRLYFYKIIAVIYCYRIYLCLYYSRLGGDFSGGLYHRLEITFHSHAAVDSGVVLRREGAIDNR